MRKQPDPRRLAANLTSARRNSELRQLTLSAPSSLAGRHQRQPAAGANQPSGCLDGGFHLVHRPQSHTIKTVMKCFCPPGMHLGIDSQHANGLAEKASLLALRLGQGDSDLRTAERDRYSGEASARAEVQQRCNSSRQRAGADNRLNKMPAQNSLFVANRRQIHARIPAKQKRKIHLQTIWLDSTSIGSRPSSASSAFSRFPAISSEITHCGTYRLCNPPWLPNHRCLHKRREDRAGKCALCVSALGMPLHAQHKMFTRIQLDCLNDSIAGRDSAHHADRRREAESPDGGLN